MIGHNIRQARLAQQLSLSDVAERANISVATLSRVENQKQGLDLALFLTLARVLKIPAQELLDESEETTEGTDPLVRRIAALHPTDRTKLWQQLAKRRRTNRQESGKLNLLRQQLDELLAQVDFVRQEIEAVRKRVSGNGNGLTVVDSTSAAG